MHAANGGSGSSERRRFFGRAPRTRSVLLSTGLLVVVMAPFGVAATGDSIRQQTITKIEVTRGRTS